MKKFLALSQPGMTMLEVMIATLLFVVFMGVFLSVTELTAQLLRGVKGGRSASELALARTTTRLELKDLAARLSSAKHTQVKSLVGPANCLVDHNSNLAGLKSWTLTSSSGAIYNWFIQQKQLGLVGNPVPFPGGIERVCLYSFKEFPETSTPPAASITTAPGLYVLQAEPLQAGPLSQPLRLVLCRPDYLC